MAKKTFKQFQNDAKGLTDKQFGKLLDKKGIKRPDVLKKIKEDFYKKKYDVRKGGYQKTNKMTKSNKRSGDSKAQYREVHKDLAKESVKRDKYGDPIGGPKISKKKLKKNLSTYEGDDKNV